MKRLLLSLILLVSVCQGYVADKPILGIPLNPDHSLSRGLVGVWLFNERPGALGRAYDLSGNGNHGTLVGDTHSVPGRFGNALDFDGTGDYVDLGRPANLLITTEMTLSFWHLSAGNYTSNQGLAFCVRDSLSSTGLAWGVTFGFTANKYEWFHAGYILPSNASISTDQWRHITITRCGSAGNWTVSIYIDGVLDVSEVTALDPSPTTDTSFVAIGRPGAADFWYTIGQISDVMIYNRCLSAGEVASLHLDSFQMFEQERLPIASGAAPAEEHTQVIIIMASGPLILLLLLWRLKITEGRKHERAK